MPKFKPLTEYEQDEERLRNEIIELMPAEHKGKALGLLKAHSKASKGLVMRDIMNGIFSNRAYIKKKHEL